MNLDDFIKIYKPVLRNSNGSTFYDKYLWETIKDMKEMEEKNIRNVWTVIDLPGAERGDFDFFIKPGLFYYEMGNPIPIANQLGWIITENQWENQNLAIEI